MITVPIWLVILLIIINITAVACVIGWTGGDRQTESWLRHDSRKTNVLVAIVIGGIIILLYLCIVGWFFKPEPQAEPAESVIRLYEPDGVIMVQPRDDFDIFLDAIAEVEGDDGEVGDAGEIGPYRITPAYLQDANEHGAMKFAHDEMCNPRHARIVMNWYWKRYCPKALMTRDYRTLARVHHGGPRGADKPHTREYAERVINIMMAPRRQP